MKINRVIFSFLLLFFLSSNLYAAEKMVVKDIEFLSGTTLEEELPKYINLKQEDDIRFFVTSDNKIEMIDKKNNQTYILSENINNPIAIYSIEIAKPKLIFYAILDRDIKNNNKTNFFTLVGFSKTDNTYIEHLTLDKLKELGWTSDRINIRRLKNSLIIEGLSKENGKAQFQTQNFVLRWDSELNSFSVENLTKTQEEISSTKFLKPEDFKLGEIALDDNISRSLSRYGQPDKIEEFQTSKDQTIYRNSHNKSKIYFYHLKDDDTIISFYTINKDIPTPREISVGMKMSNMIEKYGYNHKIKYLTNLTLYSYYLDGDINAPSITFMINTSDVIAGILLEKYSIEIKKVEEDKEQDKKENDK